MVAEVHHLQVRCGGYRGGRGPPSSNNRRGGYRGGMGAEVDMEFPAIQNIEPPDKIRWSVDYHLTL